MNAKKNAEAESIMKRKVENNPKQANSGCNWRCIICLMQQHAEFVDKTMQALNDEKTYPEGYPVHFYFFRTRYGFGADAV